MKLCYNITTGTENKIRTVELDAKLNIKLLRFGEYKDELVSECIYYNDAYLFDKHHIFSRYIVRSDAGLRYEIYVMPFDNDIVYYRLKLNPIEKWILEREFKKRNRLQYA